MPQIQIVTDSSASFNTQPGGVVIAPNQLEIDGKLYREQIDITSLEALQRIAQQTVRPKVISPTVADFLEIYRHLSHTSDAIISIHPSRELFPSWQNARAAAQQIGSSCEIAVIDSRALCAAQGMLVHVADTAIKHGLPFDDIVRQVRAAVDRIYAIYCTTNVNFLGQSKIMSQSHMILGAMMGIKPFLTIEDGELRLIEKVKNRTQVVEQLVEFASEFEDIEAMMLLQAESPTNEYIRALQDRLMTEYSRYELSPTLYSPALASIIGAEAIGLVILEEELDDYADY